MTTPDQDAVFPVVIHMKGWQRLLFGVFFAVLTLAGVAGTFFSFGDDHRAAFFVWPLAMVMFGAMFWMVAAGKFTLWPDRIENFNGFWRNAMPRARIEGYRLVKSEMVLYDKDRSWRWLSLPAHVYRNAHVIAWLGDIPDLDAVRDLEEQAAMEADAGLGATVEERRALIARLKKLSEPLEWLGLLGGGWAMFYPHPYLAAVIAAAAMPLLAIAVQAVLAWRYDLGRASTDPRPAMAMAMLYFMGPVALCARATLDVDLLDWQTAIGVSFFLGVGLLIASRLLFDDLQKIKRWGLLIFLPLTFAYAYGGLVEADMLFDNANPAVYPVIVRDKSTSGSRTTTYHLDVSEWGVDKRAGDIEVTHGFYDDVKAGDRICIYVRPGWLHLRWYGADIC